MNENLSLNLIDVKKEEISNNIKKNKVLDFYFHKLTLGFASLVFIILAAIIISLFIYAWPSLKQFGLGFFFSSEWDVVNNKFGVLIPIYGTLVTSIIAILIALPISFGIALFLTEMCPAFLKKPLGIAIELLAAIPSIIYGMFGLFVFAPIYAKYIQPFLAASLGKIPVIGALFSGSMNGIGILCAGIILAFMIIPFIASIMRDVFEIVPKVLKESAYGMGGTTWEVVTKIVLPYTKTGVLGGIMLGLGRALGETMAVTFVIGNAVSLDPSLFAPGSSITSVLANQFGEAEPGLHFSSLFAIGLMLFVITFIVLMVAKVLIAQVEKKQGVKS
jgi:phosphate transport system permease protein